MLIGRFCAAGAASAFVILALASCASPGLPATVAASPPPTTVALPLNEAVDRLTITLLTRAEANLANGTSKPPARVLVIDPLIDRATGNQTATTRSMESRMLSLVRSRFDRLTPQPFTVASLDAQPLVLVGMITPVSEPGAIPTTTEPTQTYRIWAALADLRTKRIVSKEMAWVRAEDVDMTPSAFFDESPSWLADRSHAAYVRTCTSTTGDVVDPAYVTGLYSAALVADGIRAYEAGEYEQALRTYAAAQQQQAGDQIRVYNGIYLANMRLGRTEQAEEAFGNIVGYGLERGKLAVKMVFSPGTTLFWPDRAVSGPYPMWLRQIASQTSIQAACMQLVGHTSQTGSAAANVVLSRARAEAVRTELIERSGGLSSRTAAEGRGSSQLLVGSGRDDASDALDRRVEFETRSCMQTSAGAPTRS